MHHRDAGNQTPRFNIADVERVVVPTPSRERSLIIHAKSLGSELGVLAHQAFS